MDDIQCIHCGGYIQYDDYFEEWQHTYTSDPNCKDDNEDYLYTYATPPTIKETS